MVGINGERVRELREQRVLERGELADLAGVGYTTIYKMESKNHKPRLSTIRAVAKVLRVKPEELLSETNGRVDERVPQSVGA